MPQPIDPFRADPWRRIRDDEDYSRPTTQPTPPRAPRDASQLPALPDVHADLLARASRSAIAAATSPRPLLAGLIDASSTIREVTPTQKRLDSFLESATSTYHTPEGDVTVSVGFWMGGPVDPKSAAAVAKAAHAAGIGDDDLRRAHVGRASPEVLRKLTQSLIALGRLPPSDGAKSLPDRVRKMMRDHGIGIDCAGYVQQALVTALGVTRERAHLRDMEHEDLSGLAGRGYRHVAEADLRAGDIIALQPRPEGLANPLVQPVGHRAIVFDQHMADPAELAELAQASDAPEVKRAVAGGKVRVLVVDSSWGSGTGDTPQWGGVERRTWLHDEANKLWFWKGNGGFFHVTRQPYDHPPDDMYRLQGT